MKFKVEDISEIEINETTNEMTFYKRDGDDVHQITFLLKSIKKLTKKEKVAMSKVS